MLIRMTATTPGSPDGAHVFTYEAGTEYSVPDELALVFVEQIKVAVRVALPPDATPKGEVGSANEMPADGEGDAALRSDAPDAAGAQEKPKKRRARR